MQNSFWLVSKADFNVRFVFSVVENPGVLSGIETISEIEISTKVVFKKYSVLSQNQLSGFFHLISIRFRWDFLIERSIEVLLSCKEWAIFDIWGWSYSAPKFEK